MSLWSCPGCGRDNASNAKLCAYCQEPKESHSPGAERPWERPPKPLPERPAKGTAMYDMALEAAEFISRIPMGTGQRYDREAHRQHLGTMAHKYPGVGWEAAVWDWERTPPLCAS